MRRETEAFAAANRNKLIDHYTLLRPKRQLFKRSQLLFEINFAINLNPSDYPVALLPIQRLKSKRAFWRYDSSLLDLHL